MKVTDKPTEVKLWQATNPDARDFRLDKIGKAYQSSPVQESKPGVYHVSVTKPDKGFTAFFVELAYPSGISFPLKVTTGVKVVPDVYPFEAPALGSAKGPGSTSTPQAVSHGSK